MLYLLLAAVLVAVDQIVKALVRLNIGLGEQLPFLPPVLGLTYAQNTGAAFSMLEEHPWILTLISLAASILLLILILRRTFPGVWPMCSLALVLAGAVGNLIDRAFLGYVTDMFQTLFMTFPIFNVADICIVCGGISFVVYYLFFGDKDKKEDGHDATGTEG